MRTLLSFAKKLVNCKERKSYKCNVGGGVSKSCISPLVPIVVVRHDVVPVLSGGQRALVAEPRLALRLVYCEMALVRLRALALSEAVCGARLPRIVVRRTVDPFAAAAAAQDPRRTSRPLQHRPQWIARVEPDFVTWAAWARSPIHIRT